MEIAEEMNAILKADKTAIALDPGFGPPGFFNITKSVVITWGILLAWLLICLFLTHNMRVNNISRRQAIAELIVVKLREIARGMLGEGGAQYADYIITVLLYIGLSNLTGLLGLTPPTMDLNVTVALALMSIVLVEVAGIRAKGTKGWLKAFREPIPVVLPMNILELGIRPLSLCMRLFGNVLGATVIMELIKVVVPIFVPALLSIYFDLFDGLIQAYVFCFLTSLYIAEATEPKEEESEEEKEQERLRREKERAERKEARLKKIAEEGEFNAGDFYRRLLMLPPKKKQNQK